MDYTDKFIFNASNDITSDHSDTADDSDESSQTESQVFNKIGTDINLDKMLSEKTIVGDLNESHEAMDADVSYTTARPKLSKDTKTFAKNLQKEGNYKTNRRHLWAYSWHTQEF